MEVYESQPYYIDAVLSGLKERFGLTHEREGIHLTDCLLCLRRAYYDKVDPLPPSMTELLYFILGLALQDTLGIGTKEVFNVDGIQLSPDFITEARTPVELKTTRLGKKRLDAHDFPKHWIQQIQGYCYALVSQEADLLLLTLIRPELLNYHLVFTYEELAENWRMVLLNAVALQNAIAKKTPPAKTSVTWQCTNCRYRLHCSLEEAK